MTVSVAQPLLIWTSAADRAQLAAEGWDVIAFKELLRDIVRPARNLPQRSSISPPAETWLQRITDRRTRGVAVVDVELRDVEHVRALHGYVLDPALRSGRPVLVHSHDRLTRLNAEEFADPDFQYPYTLQRALHAARRLHQADIPQQNTDPRPDDTGSLDAEQRAAAAAPGGPVQVIAPAGSGKTTVLIERVRTLLSRGADADRVLCTTFNKDAQVELDERLKAAGVTGVQARTFHSLGRWICAEERLLRPGGLRGTSLSQWRRLSAIASKQTGAWVDPADAAAAVSQIKLGMLCTPQEFKDRHRELKDGEALHVIYTLYEKSLADRNANDFDDLILLAVRALRERDDIRGRWQDKFEHVLVDEYQDIEPAQELLVRILAAPQDNFFAVGDADQCLYGWRRATVRRIVDLDLAYPGLHRVSLAHNYRCPADVVHASRQLIGHNQLRFPLQIEPAPDAPAGPVKLKETAGRQDSARHAAQAAAAGSRGETVILARTTNLLRDVALACVNEQVKISAPDEVFEPRGARAALEAYLRLCSNPAEATEKDVLVVFRAPNRGLPFETEKNVASMLREGFTFTQAVAGLNANSSQRNKLDTAGRVLDQLTKLSDARRFVQFLRSAGGLDEYFTEYEQTFGGAEDVELEALEQAQAEAAGMTISQYSSLLKERTDALLSIRDEQHGVELTTIHRAKGRQWPDVFVFGCEEKQLPHKKALEASRTAQAAGEGVEAERRLAYVAFTRAQRNLTVIYDREAASRFLSEAGLKPSSPYRPADSRNDRHPQQTSPHKDRDPLRRTAKKPDRPQRPAHAAYQPPPLPERTFSDGLLSVMRSCDSAHEALAFAAAAMDHGLIGAKTLTQHVTCGQLLEAAPGLTLQTANRLLRRAGGNADARVVDLPKDRQRNLMRGMRVAAQAPHDI